MSIPPEEQLPPEGIGLYWVAHAHRDRVLHRVVAWADRRGVFLEPAESDFEWPLVFAVRSDAVDDKRVVVTPRNLRGSRRTHRRSDRKASLDHLDAALDGVLDYVRKKRSGSMW